MSDPYQKYVRKRSDRQSIARYYIDFLTRSIVLLSLSSIGLAPLLALPTPPTTKIDNQATGSFTDGDDLNAVQESIVSNVVSVIVAEVAGITIVPTNTPTAVTGSITNFDFTIQNIGNDSTKFFLPTAPSNIVTGGTVSGPLQVVGYIPAGGTQANITAIDITTATTTDLLSDPTIGGKTTLGSIPPGAAIVVRVRVNVTALAGSPVSVTLGNTTGSPIASNTPYIANTHDVYTVDNPDNNSAIGEFDGIPINGDGTPADNDATKHRQEASAVQTVNAIAPPLKISGTVFEDINYGGGAGRSLVAASGVPRPNVLVEIYSATGSFMGRTITDTNGLYTFNAGNMTAAPVSGTKYQIRVVNSFVTSSRPGGCLPSNSSATPLTPPAGCAQMPVQTFRTNGDLNNDSIADPDTNRVGGEQPAKSDAQFNPNNKSLAFLNAVVTSEMVESLTSVTLGATGMDGVDFGFNFDTIVNTNNLKQGSLRQFVINSNQLTNAGLDQVANPNPVPGNTAIDPAPGVETTIFMIPASTLPLNGVAKIQLGVSPTGGRLIITDGFTAIDGRTQTINQGNTNNTSFGDTTTAIGVGGTLLTGIAGPEIEIELTNDIGIYTSGTNTYFHSIAFTGAAGAAIETTATAKNSRIENVLTGTISAAQNQPSGDLAKSFLINGDNTTIDRNLIRSTVESVLINSLNTGVVKDTKITNNQITTGTTTANSISAGACIHIGTSTNAQSAFNTRIENNYLHNCAWGIEMDGNSSGANTTILKNTIDLTKNSGILINSGEHDHTIQENIISRSSGAGIVVERGVTGVKITKNSIYRNGSVGIDLSSNKSLYITQGLTPNSGNFDSDYGNNRMNYPVIMSSVVTGNSLRIKGFVGGDILTSNKFANANIEVFEADNDGNQNGAVFVGDLRNKPHGEGKTYIDSCAANSNGEFDCTFTVATGFNARNITATATTTDGTQNTSEFSASPMLRANVVMIKRITAINGNILENPNDNTPLNTFVDDPSSITENNCSWPGSYPNGTAGQCQNDDYTIGAIDGGKVKPGDEIEYTIYYLNAGENKAFQGRICDRIDANSTFKPDFDSTNQNKGIALVENNGVPKYLTNTNTDTDRGQVTTAALAGATCNLAASTVTNQSNEVVVVDIASVDRPLIGSIDLVNSTVSHGYIRFKVKVK